MGEEYVLFYFKCDCGKEVKVTHDEPLCPNLVGMMQFVCPDCKKIINLSPSPIIQKYEEPVNFVGNLDNLPSEEFKAIPDAN